MFLSHAFILDAICAASQCSLKKIELFFSLSATSQVNFNASLKKSKQDLVTRHVLFESITE